MNNYIKSLLPYRWLAPAVFIIMIEILIFYLPSNFIYVATIINVFTWFYVDYTIGLGRKEERVLYNIFGILYLVCLALFLLFVANNQLPS